MILEWIWENGKTSEKIQYETQEEHGKNRIILYGYSISSISLHTEK